MPNTAKKSVKKTRIFKGSDGLWHYAKSGDPVKLKGQMKLSNYTIVKMPAKYKNSMKGGAMYKPHPLSGLVSWAPPNVPFPHIRRIK